MASLYSRTVCPTGTGGTGGTGRLGFVDGGGETDATTGVVDVTGGGDGFVDTDVAGGGDGFVDTDVAGGGDSI